MGYLPRTFTKAGRKITLYGVNGGHIGKAVALRDSAFDFPVFLDGDTWACSGWLEMVTERVAAKGGNVDVIWTLAQQRYGATRGKGRVYVTESIKDEEQAYYDFHERNTGTILAVRRTKNTNEW